MARRADLPVEEIAHRYSGGAPLRELATAYQVSTGTIRDRLAAVGVPLRRRGAPTIDVDIAALVRQTHLTGSRRAAARRLGLGRSTAGRRLRENAERQADGSSDTAT